MLVYGLGLLEVLYFSRIPLFLQNSATIQVYIQKCLALCLTDEYSNSFLSTFTIGRRKGQLDLFP